jgi:hypothetical protein
VFVYVLPPVDDAEAEEFLRQFENQGERGEERRRDRK